LYFALPLDKPAIKASVLDGLRDMGRTERRIPLQVGDRPGDLQDPAVGAGGEAKPVDGHFDELPRLFVDRAGGPDLAVGHAGIEQGVLSGEENDGSQPATQYMPGIIDFLGYVPFECPEDILGRLAYFKRTQGLNLDELGSFMGRDPEQLSDWLRCHKKPYRRNLESINQFLAKHGLEVVISVYAGQGLWGRQSKNHVIGLKGADFKAWFFQVDMVFAPELNNNDIFLDRQAFDR
jgi:hypothetical protein